SDIDGRFKGEILKSGSVYEGTKVGDPDEFDYMFILTEFEKICSINVTDGKYDDVSIKKRPNKPAHEFDEIFEDNNLKCSSVMEKFVDTCNEALMRMNYKSLPDNLYVLFQTDKTITLQADVNPGITTCEIQFIWCGAFYKYLFITADLVPAMRVKSWPKFAETQSELLTEDIIKQGCHVVQKSDKWRLSFSLAEQTIMNRLSDNLRSAYIEAKVARDPRVTFHCVIFEEEIEDWENHLSGKPWIDGRKLIPSYLLKLVLFDCIEDCHKNGRDTLDITSATIFSKLHKCLQENIPVPFYFMKKHNFLINKEERPYEHLAFTVSVIDYFFKHKSDRSLP
ncbi:MAG: hypothetical protein GY830_11145, partial [Bacteroidetes bacterium]|nr:hypothetical protein [Bacteroidota bacterium]